MGCVFGPVLCLRLVPKTGKEGGGEQLMKASSVGFFTELYIKIRSVEQVKCMSDC